ncbi:hypothetical protein J7L48_10735 [bacterium]|nr:hypothetical protein [bacterium]
MKKVLFCLIIVLFQLAVFSNVSNNTLNTLANKNVKVQLSDGSIYRGVLIGYDNVNLILSTKVTGVISIKKEAVIEILLDTPNHFQITPMGKSYASFNLLGFLQFGPIFSFDLKLSNNIYGGLHFRWAGIGLLYQLAASNGFEDSPSIFCSAYGFQLKYFSSGKNSNHKLYFGIFSDFTLGWSAGDLGTSYEWKSNFGGLAIAGNFGRRWRYSSKFFLDVGLIFGFYLEFWDNWNYLDEPYIIRHGGNGTVIFAMLELAFGWESKK